MHTVMNLDKMVWQTARSMLDTLDGSGLSAEQQEVIYVLLVGAATLALLLLVWAACLW